MKSGMWKSLVETVRSFVEMKYDAEREARRRWFDFLAQIGETMDERTSPPVSSASTEVRVETNPTREELPDGRVVYANRTGTVVPPGGEASISLGENYPNPFVPGFPGLPETQGKIFGMERCFKPREVYISNGFAIVEGHVGQMSMFHIVDGSEIPAEHLLALGVKQPDYPMAQAGMQITLRVRNKTSAPAFCEARVIGEELKSEGKPSS